MVIITFFAKIKIVNLKLNKIALVFTAMKSVTNIMSMSPQQENQQTILKTLLFELKCNTICIVLLLYIKDIQ
jgi:hypothetical protein